MKGDYMSKKDEKRMLNNYLITNSKQYFVPAYWLTQIDDKFEGDRMVQVNIVDNHKLYKKAVYFDRVKHKPHLPLIQMSNLYEDLYDICENWSTFDKIADLGEWTGAVEGSELEELEKGLAKVRWWGKVN